MEKIYCMVIGDIVASRKIQLDERKLIQKKLSSILNKINYDYQEIILSNFNVTLGDEFQGGIYDTSKIFEILDTIKIAISPINIRVGIGIGSLHSIERIKNSFSSDGIAYHRARKEVDLLKKIDTYEYGYSICCGNETDKIINSSLRLIDKISATWTEKQKEYIYQMKNSETIESIAKRLDVDPSTISRTINRANYKIIKSSLSDISNYLYLEYSVGSCQDEFTKRYLKLYNNNQVDIELIDDSISTMSTLTDYERIMAYSLLLKIYCQNEYNKKAIYCAEKALYLLEQKSGDYNIFRIKILNLLGVVYTRLFDIDNNNNYEYAVKAEEVFNQAKEIIKFEDDVSFWNFVILGNATTLIIKLGKYNDALNEWNIQKEILNNNYPYDHANYIRLMSQLSYIYYKMEKYEESRNVLNNTLSEANKYLNQYDYSIAVMKQRLAKVEIKRKQEPLENIKQLLIESNLILEKLNLKQGIIENNELLKEIDMYKEE